MTDPDGQPRICKLPECGKEFFQVTSWMEFCSAKCRNRAAWLERLEGMKLVRAAKGVKP